MAEARRYLYIVVIHDVVSISFERSKAVWPSERKPGYLRWPVAIVIGHTDCLIVITRRGSMCRVLCVRRLKKVQIKLKNKVELGVATVDLRSGIDGVQLRYKFGHVSARKG